MTGLETTAAIVLAGGKGTRMRIKGQKVISDLDGKPMVSYVLELLKSLGIGQIVIVVGHKADEVKAALGPGYTYALQRKRLGTGHAVKVGLGAIKAGITETFVFYGDDSAFHTKESIMSMLRIHHEKNATLSFITVLTPHTTGWGRIIRNNEGKFIALREEKMCSEEEKKISEVNDGCYLFDCAWLKNTIGKIKKSPVGEYYLTDLCTLAVTQNKIIETHQLHDEEWMGVSTKEDLERANEFIRHAKR